MNDHTANAAKLKELLTKNRQEVQEELKSNYFFDYIKSDKVSLSDKKIEELHIKREEHHVKGLEEFFALRKTWSCFIVVAIATLILSQIGILFCIGFEWIKLEKFQNIVLAFYVETFLQIVALAVIVVRFLFKPLK